MVAAKVSKAAKAAKTKKTAKDQTQSLGVIWKEVCLKQKGLMAAMAVVLIMSIVLLIMGLTALRPQNTVVIVGYGDVYGELAGISGGYRRDHWASMLAFPILALIFGVVHNVIALRVYKKYGRDVAMLLLFVTGVLVVGAVITLFRLIGEW